MAFERSRIPKGIVAMMVVGLTLACRDNGTQAPSLVFLSPESGQSQSAWPGRTLSDDLVVRTVGSDGGPVAGVTISWSTGEGGSFDPPTSTTGTDGLAATQWTLGRSATAQVAVATAEDLTASFPASVTLTGSWVSVAELPHPVAAAAVTTDGSRIYVFGGEGGTGVRTAYTQVFDPASGAWTTGADVPKATSWSTAVFVDGKLHLLGGVTDQAAAIAEHWIYDPSANSWTSGPSLPSAAAGAASGVVGSDVFVVGGIDGPGAYSAHTRVYDLPGSEWSSKADAPASRINWQGAAIGGKLYIAGGSSAGRITNTALLAYDPGTDAWSSLAPIPKATEGYAGTDADGVYCVLGGRVTPTSGSYGEPFDLLACFVPEMHSWLDGPSLPIAVEEGGAASVHGVLYLIGGRVGPAEVTGSVYRLDGSGS